MNTKPTPAYLVYHNDQVNTPTRTFFAHADLLTARKAAWTYAESLFGSQIDFADQEEVEVYLAEITQPDDPAPVIIARILQKRTYWPEAAPGDVVPIDPEQAHYHRERYKSVLIELDREYRYYAQQHHPDGFGSFTVSVYAYRSIELLIQVQVLFDALGCAGAAISSYNGTKGQSFSMMYCSPDEVVDLSEIN